MKGALQIVYAPTDYDHIIPITSPQLLSAQKSRSVILLRATGMIFTSERITFFCSIGLKALVLDSGDRWRHRSRARTSFRRPRH